MAPETAMVLTVAEQGGREALPAVRAGGAAPPILLGELAAARHRRPRGLALGLGAACQDELVALQCELRGQCQPYACHHAPPHDHRPYDDDRHVSKRRRHARPPRSIIP
eukprot:COSAG01_NODE_647_length_14531_cov_61.773489_16_plen_109_part_00